MTCDYYQCTKETRIEDDYIEHGLKFCADHGKTLDDIITRMIDDESVIPELLGFWVKSYGGAERMAVY